MPRIAITITLVDDNGGQISREGWSPLGYEDLGNPSLTPIRSSDSFVTSAEYNLVDRLRTSIDRTLLSFARHERRRWSGVRGESSSNPPEADVEADDPTFQAQYMGDFMPSFESERLVDIARSLPAIPLPNPDIEELNGVQLGQLLTEHSIVEPKTMYGIQNPKRSRPIKRVSRYKREPVI